MPVNMSERLSQLGSFEPQICVSLDSTRPRMANLSNSSEVIIPDYPSGLPIVNIEIPNNQESYRLQYNPKISEGTGINIHEFLNGLSYSDYYESLERIFQETESYCTYTEEKGVEFGISKDNILMFVDNDRQVFLHPHLAQSGFKTDGTINSVPGLGLNYSLDLSGKPTSFECTSQLYKRGDMFLQTYIGVQIKSPFLESLRINTKAQLEGLHWDDEFAKFVIDHYIKAEVSRRPI